MKKVIVVLSTYNGEKFLREQLDSILNQSYKPFQIIIRDDGSTDSTVKILYEYSKKYECISYYEGVNLKPAYSFLDLLKKTPDADYYAFSDQDDVWLSDKIEVAIQRLESCGGDLYHSAFQMVDINLNNLLTPSKHKVNSLGESLVLISATGCTMVISKRIRDYANIYTPKYMIMHDYWLLKLTYSLGGRVVYDDTPHILYRQHGNNVLGGIHKSNLIIWKNRLLGMLHPKRQRWNELSELYKGYQHLFSNESRATIEPIVNYLNYSIFKRIKVAFNKTYTTVSIGKNLLFKFAIILKNY